MAKDTGIPAFPINIPGWGDNGYCGMWLRDYFASKAMQGILAFRTYDNVDNVARDAYEVADAMMKAREIKE